MTIRKKIVSALYFMVTVSVVTGGVVFSLYQNTFSSINDESKRVFAYVETANEAREIVFHIYTRIIFNLQAGQGLEKKAVAELDEMSSTFYARLRQMQTLQPEFKLQHQQLKQAFMAYYIFSKRMLQQGDLQDLKGNPEVLIHFDQRANSLLSQIVKFEQSQSRRTQSFLHAASEGLKRGMFLSVVMALIGVTVSIFVILVITHSFALPMRKLLNAVKDTQKSSDGVQFTTYRSDEVGLLVNAFNEMKKRLSLHEQELAVKRNLEMTGRLTKHIAHEYNNILGAISVCLAGFTQQSGGRRTTPPEMLQVRELCMRGKELTGQLLSIGGGNRVGERGSIAVEALFEDFEPLISNLLPQNIRLDLDFATDIPSIPCPEAQIHSILLNLSLNAIDAMPDGGILSVTCQLQQNSDGREVIELRVKDSGRGIPTEQLDRIFDPFFTTKPVGQGTGIGLSVVRSMVQYNGGQIDLKTSKEGTTFSVRFPAGEDAGGLVPADKIILIITADKVMADETATGLAGTGLQPVVVTSATDALSLIETHHRELHSIVLDEGTLDLSAEAFFRLIELYMKRTRVYYVTEPGKERLDLPDVVKTINKPLDLEALVKVGQEAVVD